ncbi:MAG: hypothetical protein CL390_06965 [Acidiferrobacteraceae bacterium]|nr:hypothetical protein [Acidiferrobacteraceae bacterium]
MIKIGIVSGYERIQVRSACSHRAIPFTVIVERKRRDDKSWTIDHWSVIGLLPAQASKGFEKTMLRDDGHLSQYSWSG